MENSDCDHMIFLLEGAGSLYERDLHFFSFVNISLKTINKSALSVHM